LRSDRDASGLADVHKRVISSISPSAKGAMNSPANPPSK
jgi:hypothetical protein